MALRYMGKGGGVVNFDFSVGNSQRTPNAVSNILDGQLSYVVNVCQKYKCNFRYFYPATIIVCAQTLSYFYS